MEYRLEVDGAPETVPGGTAILLLHPSTADTDRVDSQFLESDTDRYLVISTRTTAAEVDEKLEFLGLNRASATVIDMISTERGYSRREADRVQYLPGPADTDGLLEAAEAFFEAHGGKRRMSLDSISELAFYGSDADALEAVEGLVGLLEQHDAVGLFHVATEVHDEEFLEAVQTHFDVIIEVDEDG